MGHFNDQLRSIAKGSKKGAAPSFFTINLLYIDLLKQITKTESILNEKYCDIDSHFGLHDYSVKIDLRNQKDSFYSETFRKVFTRVEDLERPAKPKYGQTPPSYAIFNLLNSESN